jgi:hypothetical protein
MAQMTAMAGIHSDSASINLVNLLREFSTAVIDHGEIISS